jgi:catechol 2,3-dioxygenase-like lactoylglutathione lyase family enzyme
MRGMTQVAVLDIAIFDAPDIEKEGTFYAELTGWDVVRKDADRFGLRAPNGQEIEFQRAPDHVAPQWPGQERPQQFHLDLQVADPAAHVERAIGLGATHLRDGETWITMADPAGHPFDLCQKDGVGSVMDLFAVTIDAPDASALARFYGELTGMDVAYDGPEGAMLAADDGRYVMFQQIGDDYRPPRWPDPAYPQQAHLDLLVRDMDAAEAQAVELGASRLEGGGERFRVFADPAGHPFCFVS